MLDPGGLGGLVVGAVPVEVPLVGDDPAARGVRRRGVHGERVAGPDDGASLDPGVGLGQLGRHGAADQLGQVIGRGRVRHAPAAGGRQGPEGVRAPDGAGARGTADVDAVDTEGTGPGAPAGRLSHRGGGVAGARLGVAGRSVPDHDHLLPRPGAPAQAHGLHDAGVDGGARTTGLTGASGTAVADQGAQAVLDGGGIGGEVHDGARRLVIAIAPVGHQGESGRRRGGRGPVCDRAHACAYGGGVVGHGPRGAHREDHIDARAGGRGRPGAAGNAHRVLDEPGDPLVTDLVELVEGVGVAADTRRRRPVRAQIPLGLPGAVDPPVTILAAGRRIGLVAGESRDRGVDVRDRQGAGVRRVPLIHQGRLGVLHLLAQVPHLRPGVIALPARVRQPVRPVPRQAGVAHQHHLGAVGEPGVERLQNATGLRPHARHGHALLDRRALQAPAGVLNRLPAAGRAAGPGNEAPFGDIREVHVGAADREHHQVGIVGHRADLSIHDVLGSAAVAGETRERRVHALLIEPVRIAVRPAVAAAVGRAARVVRVLGLIIAGAGSG